MLACPSRPGSTTPRNKRRAASAMEYLFCASFILVLCVAGIQTVGGMLKKSASDSAQKLEKSNPIK